MKSGSFLTDANRPLMQPPARHLDEHGEHGFAEAEVLGAPQLAQGSREQVELLQALRARAVDPFERLYGLRAAAQILEPGG